MSLTPEQLSVIRHEQGHAKVMAVAGAGKTTTLVYFVRQCLVRGVEPRRILVLMYNKAAQQDFQSKLRKLLSKNEGFGQLVVPEVRTFHSLGLRIYKQLIQMGHLPPFNQQLLTDGEIESEVWRLLQTCSDPETAKDILDQKSKWVEPAVNFIDLVKSSLKTPEEVFDASGLPRVCHFFPKVFHKFETWRKQKSKISFSDMLYDPCCFLAKHKEIAQHFSGHMQQIIVDEYQDINEIQQFLLTTIRGDRGDLMVVGDPDQTIYEFRGSRPEFMSTEFDHAFDGVTLYNLSNTFRYGHRLSLLCNFLIEKNPDRKGVLCLSHSSNPDTKIYLNETSDDGHKVIELVNTYKTEIPLNQIAILNRIWAISAPIELALLEHNIPYTLDHSVSVLDRKELACFEALLLIASGQYAVLPVEKKSELLITLLTQPFPKVRRKVLVQIAQLAAQFGDQAGKSIRQVMPDNLSNRQADQLLARSRLMDQAQTDRFTADQLLQKYFSTTEMEEGIRDSAFSAQQVDDRLETVRAFMRYFRGLQLPAKDGWQHWQVLRQKRQNSSVESIKLTSMHRAKGLEWDCVIIPSLNQRFMPYQPEGELTIPSSIESERRLMYVAMTRAKSFLHLLTPSLNNSKPGSNHEIMSPFVSEMSFETSDLVGASLAKGLGGSIRIPSEDAVMVSEYCSNVNQPRSLEIFERLHAKSGDLTINSYPKRAKRTRVNHQVYGLGVLLADEKNHWVIRFETGIEKQFDKRVASQYLEFL